MAITGNSHSGLWPLGALCWGADYLLEASEKMGVALGLSPLAVGFFLVAFGTSLPELVCIPLGFVERASGRLLWEILWVPTFPIFF